MIKYQNNESYKSHIEQLSNKKPWVLDIEKTIKNIFNIDDCYSLVDITIESFSLLKIEDNKRYFIDYFQSMYRIHTSFYFDDFDILKEQKTKNYIENEKQNILKINNNLNIKETSANENLQIEINENIAQDIPKRKRIMEMYNSQAFYLVFNDLDCLMTNSCYISLSSKANKRHPHFILKECILQTYAKKEFGSFFSKNDLELIYKIMPEIRNYNLNNIYKEDFPFKKAWTKNKDNFFINSSKLNKQTKELIELNYNV